MTAIIHPVIPSTHITYQSMRSISLIDHSTASTAITHQSLKAKNVKRQDSSNLSNMSKPRNLLKPLKLRSSPALPLVSLGSRSLYIASFLLFPSVVIHLCSPEQDHTSRTIVLLPFNTDHWWFKPTVLFFVTTHR
jgi:hypothetical protein